MGLHWAEHSVEIAGTPDECFDAIVDYETFPKWQNAVEATEVLERDRRKLGKLVRLQVDGKVRKVRYVLRYHYDRPKRLWWDFVEGEGVKNIEGEYLFQDLGNGFTRATYKLGVDPGMGIPGAVAKRVNQQVMKRSVHDLKGEVERRNGAARGSAGNGAAAGAGGGYGPLGVLQEPAEKALEVAEQGFKAAAEAAGEMLGRIRRR
jgi:uncharacterized membrane protein